MMKKKFSKIAVVLLISCMILSTTGFATAATNEESYEQVIAMITAPDTVEPNTDFTIVVEGTLTGGNDLWVNAYSFYENAEYIYTPGSRVTSITGTLVDADGFNWGSSFEKAYTFNKPEGTYKYTFIFGIRWGGHGWYDVPVDIEVTVEKSCVMPLNIDDYIQSLPDSSFKNGNGNLKSALHNKLGEVNWMFTVGEMDSATTKMQNDIIDKILKWVTDPVARQELIAMAERSIVCMSIP